MAPSTTPTAASRAAVGGGFRRHDVRVHESTDLDRCRIVRRDGIPVTDPDRTLLDVGRYLGQQRLTRAVILTGIERSEVTDTDVELLLYGLPVDAARRRGVSLSA